MEAIWMVLVTLVLVATAVSVLALVAHVAARNRRRSTGLRFPDSLGRRPGELSIGEVADDRGSVGSTVRSERG